MEFETARDKALMINSLVCLLKAMEGWQTTIEFRNENSVRGTVVRVDAHMNADMEDCTFTTLDGTSTHFEQFFVQGKNIRFVHIPDEMNIMQAIFGQIGKFKKRLNERKVKTRVDHKKRKLLKKIAKAQEKMKSVEDKKTEGNDS